MEPLPSFSPFDAAKDNKEECAYNKIQEGCLEKHKDADGDDDDDGDDDHGKIDKLKSYEENHCNDEEDHSDLKCQL